ncbi:hypothetical protein ACFFGJ_04840, partial [Cellulomonas phragmiteti]
MWAADVGERWRTAAMTVGHPSFYSSCRSPILEQLDLIGRLPGAPRLHRVPVRLQLLARWDCPERLGRVSYIRDQVMQAARTTAAR